MAYGSLENSVCPACGFANLEAYDILVKHLTISDCKAMLDYLPYLSQHEGDFYFLPSNPGT